MRDLLMLLLTRIVLNVYSRPVATDSSCLLRYARYNMVLHCVLGQSQSILLHTVVYE
jgi:hypothetical protein